MVRVCVVMMILCVAGLAQAQTPVSSSSGVTFTASANHFDRIQTAAGLVDQVTGYQLDIIAPNPVGAIFFTQALGKPAPSASNEITVRPIVSFATLVQGVIYTATVSAVGPGGAAASVPSDPFVRPFDVAPLPGAPGKPVVQ